MTALFGISANQLTSKPPRDALEFARKLLIGAYTVDDNEEMKTAFRTKMMSRLQCQRSPDADHDQGDRQRAHARGVGFRGLHLGAVQWQH